MYRDRQSGAGKGVTPRPSPLGKVARRSRDGRGHTAVRICRSAEGTEIVPRPLPPQAVPPPQWGGLGKPIPGEALLSPMGAKPRSGNGQNPARSKNGRPMGHVSRWGNMIIRCFSPCGRTPSPGGIHSSGGNRNTQYIRKECENDNEQETSKAPS